jgi:multicomponent Na+:H+ antiporter subunit E
MRPAIRFLERLIVFALLWWVLAEGDSSSWTFGVPFAVFASVASLSLTPERGWRLHPAGALRFAGFFAYHSVIGGVDVAWRAVRPSMPISPGFVTYPVRLPTQSARVLLAGTVSLLPGTLSSGFEGDTLVMHVLDHTMPVRSDVERVEERIAAALGLDLVAANSAVISLREDGHA